MSVSLKTSNNPSRVAPRHLFDLGVRTDNLLRRDKAKLRVRFSIINLTDKGALYNFLSTFSGPTSWRLERTNCNWVGPSESGVSALGRSMSLRNKEGARPRGIKRVLR